MQIMSSDLRRQYERQMANIRSLRELYEERERVSRMERDNLLRQLELRKNDLEAEQEKWVPWADCKVASRVVVLVRLINCVDVMSSVVGLWNGNVITTLKLNESEAEHVVCQDCSGLRCS